ncbi:MAG: NAD(P)H-hydrate dehydratase [Deltaproteobacteria bacterium]|jgi:NAD(P)H-hydrate epimerase|nr:NAD(P)H-hydrate dehydratase [Deltaproteobacteria bacterium]
MKGKPRLGFPHRPILIATPEESRELDRTAIEKIGIPGIVLMENAARSIVAHAVGFWPDLALTPLSVAVLGGTGQNGGDGWAIARILASMGHRMTPYLIAGPGESPKGDALVNFRAMESMGLKAERIAGEGAIPDWDSFDILVDAVFGTGLARPVDGLAAATLASVPRRPRKLRVLAADLPSGLSGADGRALGPAPEADLTVSLGACKPGHFMGDGLRLTGALRLGDIGLVDSPNPIKVRGRLLDRAEAQTLAPTRPDWGHKGTFGHAVVAGGSPGRSGALALAATGALRAGAGLVTAACPAGLAAMTDLRLAAPMCLALPETAEGFADGGRPEALIEFLKGLDGRAAALGLGPGLGLAPEPQKLGVTLIKSFPYLPLVLDADALDPSSGIFEALKARPGPAVVTPHPGEAARILKTSVSEIEDDRLTAAARLAEATGAAVALKGRHTVVMDRGGNGYRINLGGGPALAAGGSGDLLTGLIAGFLARGMDAFEAASLAVYVHAEAGDLAARAMGPQGISPMEIQRYIPLALSALSGFKPDPEVPILTGSGV